MLSRLARALQRPIALNPGRPAGRSSVIFQERKISHVAGERVSPAVLGETVAQITSTSKKCLANLLTSNGSWTEVPPSSISRLGTNLETGQLLAWRSFKPIPPKISSDGDVTLLNHDKLITFAQAAAVTALPPSNKSQVLLLDEGCDNGDILTHAVPWLRRTGKRVTITLTNGSPEKLQAASKLANWLLSKGSPPEESICLLHNSFTGPNIADISDESIQKIFMLYHLGIVERPQQVGNMIAQRVEQMQDGDVGLVTFLKSDNDVLERLGSRPGYNLHDTGFDETFTFRKRVRKSTAALLDQVGALEDDYYNYLTAMTPFAATNLVTQCGGRVIHCSAIPTTTEEGIQTKVMGLVFGRLG